MYAPKQTLHTNQRQKALNLLYVLVSRFENSLIYIPLNQNFNKCAEIARVYKDILSENILND